MLAVIVIVAIVVLVAAVAGLYNGLVRRRNRVDQAWSQVDVQLQQRYDLIPNLVETVKGYAAHERETLEAVVRARGQAVDAGSPPAQAEAENMITATLGRLFALSESYPELRANENFLALQEQLTAVEGKIAYARQHYNDSVYAYNTRIETVPSNLIAGPFGFTSREFFETPSTLR